MSRAERAPLQGRPMVNSKIELPDDYTEMTYDDMETSGSGYNRLSGNKRFT